MNAESRQSGSCDGPTVYTYRAAPLLPRFSPSIDLIFLPTSVCNRGYETVSATLSPYAHTLTNTNERGVCGSEGSRFLPLSRQDRLKIQLPSR